MRRTSAELNAVLGQFFAKRLGGLVRFGPDVDQRQRIFLDQINIDVAHIKRRRNGERNDLHIISYENTKEYRWKRTVAGDFAAGQRLEYAYEANHRDRRSRPGRDKPGDKASRQGFSVTLVERERFPRHKLCGEFISPECLAHFEDLGVLDEMLVAGGEHITETRFYAPGGRSFAVSSNAFRGRGFALSLSRAAMDLRLMEKAKTAGVNVIEDASVSGVGIDKGLLTRLTIRHGSGVKAAIATEIYVDATGRSRVLTKLAAKKGTPEFKTNSRPLFVGFKAHLTGAEVIRNTCEIYLFPGGYGGLSPIEIGLTNYCFMVRPEIAREFGGNADDIVKNVAFRNKRAAETLADFKPSGEWLAVSVDSFGSAVPVRIPNLLSVGDSAAFIDPFTGSGMLLAFESAELLAADNSG